MNPDERTLLDQMKNDAEYLVREAGKILATYQEKFTVVQMKDTVDLATSADIASEKFIVDFIRKKYPDHTIYSEEAGNVGNKSDYLWVVDPLDGTKEYSRGLHEYNCIIAIEYKGDLCACASYRAGVGDLYSAMRGEGAELLNEPVHVSHQTDIKNSFVGFHVPIRTNTENKISAEMKVLDNLVRSAYRVRPGWDDSEYCGWVARGVLDAHVVSADVNKWYDIAAGILLVEEAGGKVTDWNGNSLKNHNLSNGVVLSNTAIHDQLLTIIKHQS